MRQFQNLPSCGTRQHCVAGVGSFTWGTNLILPGWGAPSGSATPSSRIGAFPERILLLRLRVICKSLFLDTINFEVRFLKMARGWAVKRARRMADSGCGSTGSRHFTPITCRRELRQSCATPRLRISSFSVRPRCRPPATPCWSQPARW